MRDHPEKLNQLGWGVPSRGSVLDAPGEARDIAIRAEGETSVETPICILHSPHVDRLDIHELSNAIVRQLTTVATFLDAAKG